MGRDWNELHKTPTGQINLFLFLGLPSQTIIQMHAVTPQLNKYPDSHRAVSLPVLCPPNKVSLVLTCAVCQSATWRPLFLGCNLSDCIFFSLLSHCSASVTLRPKWFCFCLTWGESSHPCLIFGDTEGSARGNKTWCIIFRRVLNFDPHLTPSWVNDAVLNKAKIHWGGWRKFHTCKCQHQTDFATRSFLFY